LERFRRDESEIAAALEAAGQALQRHRRRAALLEREMAALDENIASTQAAAEDLAQRIRTGDAYLSRRLVALYKTQALGAPTTQARPIRSMTGCCAAKPWSRF
jgi:predicted  nucleic acid-binding Zn-ribbon protein